MAMAMVSHWVVIHPVADLHADPSADSAVATQAIYGAEVRPGESSGEWMRVRTPDDYEGWVVAKELRERSTPYGAAGKLVWVDNLVANLYREPDVTRHAPLLTLAYGTRLEVIAEPEAEQRRWVEVRLPDDRRAWLQRGDARFRPDAVSAGEAVAIARRFIGVPYRWGGVTSFGFDCSGFTQMLCGRRGFRTPRDAAPQAGWEGMEVIERRDLRPGDLVYFGESAAKITHTGMYIGGGEFIHATAYGRPMVQVSRLGDAHWSNLLVACRRPREEAR